MKTPTFLVLTLLVTGCASTPRLTAPEGDPDASRYVTQADMVRAFEVYRRGAEAIREHSSRHVDLVEGVDLLYHVRLAAEPAPLDWNVVKNLPLVDMTVAFRDAYYEERDYADSLEAIIDAQMLRVHRHPNVQDHGHRPGYEREGSAVSERGGQ